jgi:hypothetical protein
MTLDDKHELLLLASDGMWSHENGDGYGFGRSKAAVPGGGEGGMTLYTLADEPASDCACRCWTASAEQALQHVRLELQRCVKTCPALGSSPRQSARSVIVRMGVRVGV